MEEEYEVMGEDFNTLVMGEQEFSVDRYAVVPGLGVFLFKGGFEDKYLVYSAIGFEAPVKVNLFDAGHHYMMRGINKKNQWDGTTLYLKMLKEKRVATVKVGEPCITQNCLNKIAYLVEQKKATSLEEFFKLVENSFSTEIFDKKVQLLQFVTSRSKIVKRGYGGYVKVETDGIEEWVKQDEVYSFDEAYDKLMELSRLDFAE